MTAVTQKAPCGAFSKTDTLAKKGNAMAANDLWPFITTSRTASIIFSATLEILKYPRIMILPRLPLCQNKQWVFNLIVFETTSC
ncbi:MAG: hypothetical protein A3D65_01460 [Candidatus Lloydbacteria bacterium RIFCSPHIGHO2_02_FULL_50_13]|uniref:Uncharacterized protein n=1 Tax=Candidatus Lloydbacteria bacterium RIFCSPHIGHO2_02_FULL_50_13 TaxID=1798661 RepID=A0A1G2D2Q1_9BACT|nr:MAG: hypothetical protein A3D65_01460 [Candidatus Lloydbacteria bacterium RIFCSPHIGHO2_02_FULL_50_13]